MPQAPHGSYSRPGGWPKAPTEPWFSYPVASVVAQHEHQDHVNRCQYRKRVTERPVDDVPEMQHAVGFRREEDLFRQQRLLARHADGPFQNRVFPSPQPYQRPQAALGPQHLLAQPPDPQRKSHIKQQHPPQNPQQRNRLYSFHVRQPQQSVNIPRRQNPRVLQLRGRPQTLFLSLLKRQFRGIQAPRYLRVDVAPHYATQGHHDHDPVGHSGDPAELERGVKGDDHRRYQSE